MPAAKDTFPFDLTKFDPSHLDLLVTDINLLVYLDHQGYCDERSDLARPRSNRSRLCAEPKLAAANHYALWFGVDSEDGETSIAIDITQADYESLPNPHKSDATLREGSIARVRVASKTFPIKDDVGILMREIYNIQPGTTIRMVLSLIEWSGLQFYQFSPNFKQHAGCRYWILCLSRLLELNYVVGAGFAEDVESFLLVHYHRLTEKVKGKLKKSLKWGPAFEIDCAPISAGKSVEGSPTPSSECS
ncbi:hypothetical protein CVT26_013179 [Gymnopilus dilepis]|uniref:DUF7770 domain-containing protein n=1 Tax=Gymnopilus dilepis TaxID=231916 RepID=A0A409YFD6_9AGAR|nr:hypothetical protein CVT26_013179 [Gymnopilus dilepis]